MSGLESLYSAQVVIAGHSIYDREIVGNAFGLASAIGGMRRRVWAWPVGIVGNVLLFTVFLGTALGESHGTPLYGQAGRQVMFVVVSIYGWVRWRATRAAGTAAPAVRPRWASGRERLVAGGAALAAVGVCFVAFRAIGAGFPVAWWYYLADSWIFVGSMLATIAMARGRIEFWLCWVLVDLVGVPELIHFEYYPSAALYVIYGAVVIYGFFSWRRVSRREAVLTDPLLTVEAVA